MNRIIPLALFSATATALFVLGTPPLWAVLLAPLAFLAVAYVALLIRAFIAQFAP